MLRLITPAFYVALGLWIGRAGTGVPANAHDDRILEHSPRGLSKTPIRNGDVDCNGTIDLGDPLMLISWLFAGGQGPCAFGDGRDLAERVEALESVLTAEKREILNHMRIVGLKDGRGGSMKTVRFHSVNLQVVNGMAATNGNPQDPTALDNTETNGLGNLIVGYIEPRNDQGAENDRTGSHNIVVGTGHNYTGFGGLIAGYRNNISGSYSSVSGGSFNSATAFGSSVIGGERNAASSTSATVCGGGGNTASDYGSSVAGGFRNRTDGNFSTISGGLNRSVSGDFDWRAGAEFEDF